MMYVLCMICMVNELWCGTIPGTVYGTPCLSSLELIYRSSFLKRTLDRIFAFTLESPLVVAEWVAACLLSRGLSGFDFLFLSLS